MGSCSSKDKSPVVKSATMKEELETGDLGVYQLKKTSPRCTGLFWRKDPAKGGTLSGSNWPRDDALIEGAAVTVSDKKWLKATRVQQPKGEWQKAPEGAYLPFAHEQYYLQKV